jgi:aminomethyltransferase
MSIESPIALPLNQEHVALGAKMASFAGFSMPIQYSGIKEEHLAVRQSAGLFDVSHMGNILVSGKGALDYLEYLTVNAVSQLEEWDVQYSAVCNEKGCPLDDILVWRLPDVYHLIVNASNIDKVFAWMEQVASERAWEGNEEVVLQNKSRYYGILALQGPKAISIVEALEAEAATYSKPIAEIGRYQGGYLEFKEWGQLLYTRTGYTGEDGVEFFPTEDQIQPLWNKLLSLGQNVGLLPAGLGSRDTLRLEAGFSLYGHELNEDENLVNSGLSWIIAWDKKNFIGKEALLETKLKTQIKGPEKKIIALDFLEKGIPREGYVVEQGDAVCGRITSGTMSPTFGKGIAMASVNNSSTHSIHSIQLGDTLQVVVRNKKVPAKVVKRYRLAK